MTTEGYHKNGHKKKYLEVGNQETGTLYPSGLAKSWLTRIACDFLNYTFGTTRDVKRAGGTDRIVFF